jgi:hypothetical protein
MSEDTTTPLKKARSVIEFRITEYELGTLAQDHYEFVTDIDQCWMEYGRGRCDIMDEFQRDFRSIRLFDIKKVLGKKRFLEALGPSKLKREEKMEKLRAKLEHSMGIVAESANRNASSIKGTTVLAAYVSTATVSQTRN